ncbi:MAG: DUF5946 family protein, partial [Chloroflexota bacterium]|nr:DUF5946 family protein [Chloroflexota bacterium]
MTAHMVPCPDCGGLFPDIDGSTHRYLGASPGCWQAFGELQAGGNAGAVRVYIHRLTTDAYCAQHPGVPGKQS